MKSLKDYIATLLAQGKYFLIKQEALSVLNISESQFRFQAYRLSQKKVLRRLIHNFFMIIPAEYHRLGSLPPSWIVDHLMKYMQQEYYIGLLSAAAIYGATEQQPMTFQVITNKAIRPIQLDRMSIEFHVFKDIPSSSITKLKVATGYAKIATREQTLVDLVRFYVVSGYMSNVALVIKSLAEECDTLLLTEVISREKTKTVLQRLGYILEVTGFPKLAEIVASQLANKRIEYTLFRPDFHEETGKRVNRWKLILNDTLELT